MAALALLLALLPVSGALAAAKKKGGGARLSTATATASVSGAFSPVTAIATCPKGTRAVSGGYTTSVPNPPSSWLNVSESQLVGKRSWQVSGAEYFGGSDTLTAYAYCQAFSGKIQVREAQVAVDPTVGSSAVVQANCPGGTKAISGGFSTEVANASDSTYVSRSIAAGGSRWVVDATRLTGAAGRSLLAHVYCAALKKLPSRSAQTAVGGPLGSAHAATTPACPKGRSARGGGFATSTPVGGLLNAALVYETRRAGAVWSSSAAPSSGSTSITLLTAAYCR